MDDFLRRQTLENSQSFKRKQLFLHLSVCINFRHLKEKCSLKYRNPLRRKVSFFAEVNIPITKINSPTIQQKI